MMLQIVPTHWYSWDVTVTDESRRVADIAIGALRERGTMTIDETTYRLYRESPMSGAFVLEREGVVLARAEKPSVFRREFVIRYGSREYTLRPESLFRRAFVLMDGSRQVGSIAPNGAFTRKAAAELPPDLPLPGRMFVVWLTMISWRRQQNS
jgi:hypothetical protein